MVIITGVLVIYGTYNIINDKDTSVDEFSISFYLHKNVTLLYCDSMSHS